MSQINSYLFADEEFDEIPELASKRIKVNRIRYQQVKDILKLKHKYNHRQDSQIADDFDISASTLSKIKRSKSYNKYLKRGQNERTKKRKP